MSEQQRITPEAAAAALRLFSPEPDHYGGRAPEHGRDAPVRIAIWPMVGAILIANLISAVVGAVVYAIAHS